VPNAEVNLEREPCTIVPQQLERSTELSLKIMNREWSRWNNRWRLCKPQWGICKVKHKIRIVRILPQIWWEGHQCSVAV